MEIRPAIFEPAVMYELLATAVEQTADSIVVTDPKGTIIFVNPGFEVTTVTPARKRSVKRPSF
jgi:PAS domain-containing protein